MTDITADAGADGQDPFPIRDELVEMLRSRSDHPALADLALLLENIDDPEVLAAAIGFLRTRPTTPPADT
jgi:hypothetical protein